MDSGLFRLRSRSALTASFLLAANVFSVYVCRGTHEAVRFSYCVSLFKTVVINR